MEKIMSKTKDTSKLRIEDVEAFTLDLGGDATCTGRELRDDELQKVSGGHKFYDLLISSYHSG
jgi:bacteriocin-like protein